MTNLSEKTKTNTTVEFSNNQTVYVIKTQQELKIKSNYTAENGMVYYNTIDESGNEEFYGFYQLESLQDKLISMNRVKKFIDNAMNFNGLKSFKEVNDTLNALIEIRDCSKYIPESHDEKLYLYIANLKLILKANGYK